MKVHIGPYLTWWGPYQIADLLQHVGVHEDKCHKIGEWLADTWVGDLCQWIHDKRKRTVKVRIDNYDIWSADNTLTAIILPLLKKYRENITGSPFVDDEDVPDEIKSTNAPPVRADWGETDEHFHARWLYVIDKMIWAFERLADDEDDAQFHVGGYGPEQHARYVAHQAEIQKGLALFGKYYQGIWT